MMRQAFSAVDDVHVWYGRWIAALGLWVNGWQVSEQARFGMIPTAPYGSAWAVKSRLCGCDGRFGFSGCIPEGKYCIVQYASAYGKESLDVCLFGTAPTPSTAPAYTMATAYLNELRVPHSRSPGHDRDSDASLQGSHSM